MDEEIRNLERLAAQGDIGAEDKLYRSIIRSGTIELEARIFCKNPKLLERRYLEAKKADKLVKYNGKDIFPDQLAGLHKLADQLKSVYDWNREVKPITYLGYLIDVEFGVIREFREVHGFKVDKYESPDHLINQIKGGNLIFPDEFIFLNNLELRDPCYLSRLPPFTGPLDISSCHNLNTIKLHRLKVKNLDFSNNHELKNITLEQLIQLDSLNLENNKSVKSLKVNYCNLTKLNLSNHDKLKSLDCNTNELNELNLTNCTNLTDLNCDNNNLTELDLKTNSELIRIYVLKNDLEKLDLSYNHKLRYLRTQISRKDIKFSEEACEGLRNRRWFFKTK